MTTDVWRDDDFEERNFYPPLYTASGATSSTLEVESYLHSWKPRHADLIYVRPPGRVLAMEVKNSPTREHEFFVWWSLCGSYRSNRENMIIGYHRALDLLNHSVIDLSRSALYELSRSSDLCESVSASYAILQGEELPVLEVIHPLTRPIYNQLGEIPTTTKEAIQDVLKSFATSVSYTLATKLPPLRLTVLEDSSYLLEWTFQDRRLGFYFDQNPKDSGWYYVYSSDSSERYESGTMDQLEMSRLIGMTLKS